VNLNFNWKLETRLVLAVLVLTALFTTVYSPGPCVYGEGSEGVWVLTDVIDYDREERVKKANKEYEGVYHYEVNYSRGSFSLSRTYTGKTENKHPYPDAIHGESMAVKAEWSSPPRIMRPGQKYSLDFYLGVLEDNSSYYTLDAWAATWFNRNKLKNSYVKLNYKTDWRPINETLTLKPREGQKVGEKRELVLSISSHQNLKTVYVYEWMKASDASKVKPPAPYKKLKEPEPEEAEPEPAPPRELDTEVPKDEDGNYIDSGIRFSNLHGEVMVRRGDDPLGWEFAQLDMVIYEGDRIRTEHNSGVEMTLKDLTTFKMKPESEIIVNTAPERKNKMVMLAGKVWTNVKQMITEGTMDVEMSQAVAGIKGTTFVVEETGSESVLKVIDGKVELKTNTGDKLIVTGGAMATVKRGSPAKVRPFSLETELASWNLDNRDWRGTEGKGTSSKDEGDKIYITTEGDLYPLFTDDFNDDSLEDWETVHGSWKIEDGILAQTSNYWKGGVKGGTYAFTGSPNWTDYSVSARVMSEDDDTIGLIFRYRNEDSCYVLGWNKQDKELRFSKIVDDKTTQLVLTNLGYEEERWYRLKVEVVGDEMSAFIDGEKIFSVVDDDLSRGMVGLYCHGNDGSYFDDFEVREISR